jgi:integrase
MADQRVATQLIEELKRRGWARDCEDGKSIPMHPLVRGGMRLTRLPPEQLERLYARMLDAGSSARTVRHVHAVLHNALERATKRGRVARNVAQLVDPPAVPRSEKRVLNEDEAQRFLAAIRGDRFEALYLLAISTGMREGELLGLRWQDLDLERGAIQVRQTVAFVKGGGYVFGEPKTAKSRRNVILTAVATAELRRHRMRQAESRLAVGAAWQDLDLVFTNEVGGPVDGSNVLQRHFYPLLARAGLPRIRFHDLRHTCATLLLGRGVHPKVVSEMLGHSTVAITMDTYSHVLPTMQREAAAALDAALGGRGAGAKP